MSINPNDLPTTPILDYRIDRLFHDIDRYEYRAFERNEPFGYFHDQASGLTDAAITLGLRGAEIGPPVPAHVGQLVDAKAAG